MATIMAAQILSKKKRLRLLSRFLRVLPPFIAFRLFFRLLSRLIANPVNMSSKGLYGPRALTSSTSDIVDLTFHMLGSMNLAGMVVAKSVAREGDAVIEIGANLGTETLTLSNIVGDTGQVLAIEADPDLADIVCNRLRRAGVANVNVVAKAVSSHESQVGLVRGEPKNRGETYVSEEINLSQIVVPAVSLDQVIKENAIIPSLVVMDVEGSECRVVQGARHCMKVHRPCFITEVNHAHLERAGDSALELFILVSSFGYLVFDLSKRSLPLVGRENCTTNTNGDWFLVPRELEPRVGAIRRRLFLSRVAPRLPGLSPLCR